jgi:RNA polymerase sigma-70 factor (ECF subfamily)
MGVVSRRLVRLDDEALLALVAAGEHRAFVVFYDRHLPGVLAYFRGRVEGGEVAFDLAAETFASVLAGVAGFDGGKGRAVGWLYAIARNALIDALRRRAVSDQTRRRLQMQPVELYDADLLHIESLSQSGIGRLEAAMAALSDQQREAILARVVHERSYAQIAAELACSQSVVRQRVSRGLRQMRRRLEGQP